LSKAIRHIQDKLKRQGDIDMERFSILTLILMIMLIISGCGAKATPPPAVSAVDMQNTSVAVALTMVAQTQAATAEPTPSTPMIEVDGVQVTDPEVSNPELFDITKPDSPIPQYVEAIKTAGIEVTDQQVLDALANPANYHKKQDSNGNPYIQFTYTTSEDGLNYSMALIYDEENGWRERSLNDKDSTFGLEATGNDSKDSPLYNELFDSNSSVVFTGGMLLQRTDPKYRLPNAERARSLAGKDNELYIHAGFYPNDEYPTFQTNEEKEAFVDKRLRWLYSFVKKADEGYQPTTINLINEANSTGYDGLDPDFILHDLYGNEEFTKIYVKAYRMAEELGLELGKDVRFLFSDAYVIGQNGKQKAVEASLKGAKQDIAKELGISPDDVQFDFAMQLRLYNDKNPGDSGPREKPPTVKQFNDAVNLFKEIVGPNGRLYVSEISVANTKTPEEIIKILSPLLESGLSSGKVHAFIFEAALRTENNYYDLSNKNIQLFNNDYTKGLTYYYLMDLLTGMN